MQIIITIPDNDDMRLANELHQQVMECIEMGSSDHCMRYMQIETDDGAPIGIEVHHHRLGVTFTARKDQP